MTALTESERCADVARYLRMVVPGAYVVTPEPDGSLTAEVTEPTPDAIAREFHEITDRLWLVEQPHVEHDSDGWWLVAVGRYITRRVVVRARLGRT